MVLESLSAILPVIPQMLEAGKSVWAMLIKPSLEGLGYNYSQKLEQTILALEEKKIQKISVKFYNRLKKNLVIPK